jgi:hypothetical protein
MGMVNRWSPGRGTHGHGEPVAPCRPGLRGDKGPCGRQVSFYRANLFLKVVKKPGGSTKDGKPADKEALVQYVRCAARLD